MKTDYFIGSVGKQSQHDHDVIKNKRQHQQTGEHNHPRAARPVRLEPKRTADKDNNDDVEYQVRGHSFCPPLYSDNAL